MERQVMTSAWILSSLLSSKSRTLIKMQIQSESFAIKCVSAITTRLSLLEWLCISSHRLWMEKNVVIKIMQIRRAQTENYEWKSRSVPVPFEIRPSRQKSWCKANVFCSRHTRPAESQNFDVSSSKSSIRITSLAKVRLLSLSASLLRS